MDPEIQISRLRIIMMVLLTMIAIMLLVLVW